MVARHRLQKKFLLLIATVLGALALGELGLRVAGYEPLGELQNDRQFAIRASDNSKLLYELTPDARGRLWNCEVSINSAGMRDREYSRQKPPGTTRVIALGDSITFGNRLRVEDTWSAVLETHWLDQGFDVEVLNMGVGGYDLQQEVEFLEQTGVGFEPDHVFLAYCVNDLATVSVNLESIGRMQRFRKGVLSWSRLGQWAALALDKERTARSMQEQRDAELLRMSAKEWQADPLLEGPMAQIAEALAATDESNRGARKSLGWYTQRGRVQAVRDGFERLAELAEREHFKVSVLVIPYLDEGALGPAWESVYGMLRHLSETHGFHYVDAYPLFSNLGLEALREKPTDAIHPSPAGQRAIAQAFARRTRKWVPLTKAAGE